MTAVKCRTSPRTGTVESRITLRCDFQRRNGIKRTTPSGNSS